MEAHANLFKSAAHVQGILKAAGFESIAIGGLAVAIWGEPRTTRDVDLKVLLNREQADRLLGSLPPDYRRLSPEPEDTLRRVGFLFVEDVNGIRIDLLLAETAFDAEAMTRGRQIEATPGETVAVCTPEDLIIYKIISTRSRDYDDVPGILKRQRGKLDHEYITSWLRQFEQALDDSTLIQSYQRMRNAKP
jgi:hypothetical protein